VNSLSTKKPQKRLIFHWITFKGLAATLLFMTIAVLIECFVILYTRAQVEDETLLQWSFQFPSTNWNILVAISPLFQLVPTAVVLALVLSWTYLTKHIAVKPHGKWKDKVKPVAEQGKELRFKGMKRLLSRIRVFLDKVKAALLRVRGIAYIWRKIHFARATIKSALTVLLIFATFIVLVSLLAYPQLIYRAVTKAYQNSPSLLSSMKSVGGCGKSIAEALAPIGWICSSINDALLSITPEFRVFISNLGSLTKPLTELDTVGKYLVLQNVATWFSSLIALSYGKYRRRSYRHIRRRR